MELSLSTPPRPIKDPDRIGHLQANLLTLSSTLQICLDIVNRSGFNTSFVAKQCSTKRQSTV